MNGGFRVMDAFSRIVRLGEGLGASGRLSDAAQDRAVAALRICADKLTRWDIRLKRSVATEACRQAANRREFIDRVYAETGLALDVISTEEEARLAVIGCQSLIDANAGMALVFDIGGGSTELTLIDTRSGAIEAWISLPYGVVTMSEQFGDPANQPHVYDDMVRLVSERLAAFREEVAPHIARHGGSFQMLGTSGTVTTLASLYLELRAYDRRQVDGCSVPSDMLLGISRRLATMTVSQRASEPCIGQERADLVVSGCAILEAILAHWHTPVIKVADRGIREGILRTLVLRDQAREGGRTQVW